MTDGEEALYSMKCTFKRESIQSSSPSAVTRVLVYCGLTTDGSIAGVISIVPDR
jgi:hypothetical protein